MNKILLLFMSLFTSFFPTNDERFMIIESEVETEVVAKVDSYQIKKDHENLLLMDNKEVLDSFSLTNKVKIIKNKNHLVICNWNNKKINIKVLDEFNRLIHDFVLPGRFSEKFDIISYSGEVYFVGGISYYGETFSEYKKPYFNKTDAFICTFDNEYQISKIKIYGGSLDEYFDGIKINDNKIYLKGVKETLSGGDFGNGGNKDFGYIFIEVNKSLQLINYLTTKSPIITFSFSEDGIYLQTQNYLFHLDDNLKCQQSLKLLQQSFFGYHSPNGIGLAFNAEEVNIYDLRKDELLKIYNIDCEEIYIIDESFHLKNKDKIIEIKIYDLINFKDNYIYNGKEENQNISNLFSEVNLSNKITNPTFDPLVYGEYQVEYYYDDLIIPGKIIVPFEANVSEGVIYPPGYNLLFTGTAYLDGQLIVNNHRVLSTGNHTLTLYGCNDDEKVINFSIDKDQIPFTEYLDKTWDYEIYPHQELVVLVDANLDYEISKVKINDKLSDKFEITEAGLKIFIIESKSGIYYYHLQEVIYKVDDREVKMPINYHFKINVLKDSLNVNGQFTDSKNYIKYQAEVIDKETVIRGINTKIISGGEEIVYIFPVCDRDLLLTGLDSNKSYKCYFSLAIDEGNGIIKDFPLFDLELKASTENIRIGEINIIKKGEVLEDFEINIIKDKSIPLVYNLNDIIYEYQEKNYLPYIFVSFIISGVLFLAIRYLKK